MKPDRYSTSIAKKWNHAERRFDEFSLTAFECTAEGCRFPCIPLPSLEDRRRLPSQPIVRHLDGKTERE